MRGSGLLAGCERALPAARRRAVKLQCARADNFAVGRPAGDGNGDSTRAGSLRSLHANGGITPVLRRRRWEEAQLVCALERLSNAVAVRECLVEEKTRLPSGTKQASPLHWNLAPL